MLVINKNKHNEIDWEERVSSVRAAYKLLRSSVIDPKCAAIVRSGVYTLVHFEKGCTCHDNDA